MRSRTTPYRTHRTQRTHAGSTDDRGQRPLPVSDTSALGEFRRSRTWDVLGLPAAAIGIVGVTRMSFWAAVGALGALAITVLDYLYWRRNPILSVYSSHLVVRRSRRLARARTQQISFAELAGWRQTSRYLTFESTTSKKVFVELAWFSDADRRRLIGLLGSLKLGQPGFPGPTDADATRHMWKRLGTTAAIAIGFVLVVELLQLLGIG